MTSVYPGDYDTFRTPANEPGIAFDADQHTTIFSEDFAERSDAIVQLQHVLGLDPAGTYANVGEFLLDLLTRMQQLEAAVMLAAFDTFVTETGDFMVTESGDYLAFADETEQTLLAAD